LNISRSWLLFACARLVFGGIKRGHRKNKLNRMRYESGYLKQKPPFELSWGGFLYLSQ